MPDLKSPWDSRIRMGGGAKIGVYEWICVDSSRWYATQRNATRTWETDSARSWSVLLLWIKRFLSPFLTFLASRTILVRFVYDYPYKSLLCCKNICEAIRFICFVAEENPHLRYINQKVKSIFGMPFIWTLLITYVNSKYEEAGYWYHLSLFLVKKSFFYERR